MSKMNLFTEETINELSWEETFDIAKSCAHNAEELHQSGLLLYKNEFQVQAFNYWFIACEEYYKAINFESIAFIKMQSTSLKEDKLRTFVKKFGDHRFKIQTIFNKTKINIPNFSIKTKEGIDDRLIQDELQKDILEIFTKMEKLDAFVIKNNSLYVGYDNEKELVSIPQKTVSSELIEDMKNVCFYVKQHCQISKNDIPTGVVEMIIEWGDY